MRELFLLPFGLMGIAPAAHAGNPACAAMTPTADARVDYTDDGLQLDLNHSYDDLTPMGPEVRDGYHTRGLTKAKFGYRISVAYQAGRLQDGTYCVTPGMVSVKIGYADMTVYVAREYPAGSCQYDAVLEHEYVHVRINRENLATLGVPLQIALKRSLSDPAFPLLVAVPEEAVSYIKAVATRTIAIETDAMTMRRDEQHRTLDSPSSYAYTQDKCPSW